MAMQSLREMKDAQTWMKDQGRTSVSSVSCPHSFLYFPMVLQNHLLNMLFAAWHSITVHSLNSKWELFSSQMHSFVLLFLPE